MEARRDRHHAHAAQRLARDHHGLELVLIITVAKLPVTPTAEREHLALVGQHHAVITARRDRHNAHAARLNHFIDLMRYADSTVEDFVLGGVCESTAAGAQARVSIREHRVSQLRSCIDRMLYSLSLRAGRVPLCLTPEIKEEKLDLNQIMNLYDRGFISKEEARAMISKTTGHCLNFGSS